MTNKYEKRSKSKSSVHSNENKPLAQDAWNYDKNIQHYFEAQKVKLRNAKHAIKRLTEKNKNIVKSDLEKHDIIKELKQSCEELKEKLAKSVERQNEQDVEIKAMKLNLIEKDTKYVELEAQYDKNINHFNLEKSKVVQELQSQIGANEKLAQEFAKTYNDIKAELLQETEKVTELRKQLIQEAEKVTQLKEQHVHEANAIEERISAKAAEIETLREKITGIENEKSDLNDAFKREIQEYKAKLAAVNRALSQQQHVKHVPPTINASSNRTDGQFEVPKNNITANSVNFSQTSIVRANTPNLPQTSSDPIRHNEFSSDSDSDMSTFRPYNNFNLSLLAPTSHGFGRLKRTSEQNIVIPETSESESNVTRSKRSKKQMQTST